jgi:hypothetical protein
MVASFRSAHQPANRAQSLAYAVRVLAALAAPTSPAAAPSNPASSSATAGVRGAPASST